MKWSILLSFLISCSAYCQLPGNWLGHYQGQLTAIGLNGKSVEYAMALEIALKNDSTYSFTIIYGEDSLKQERAYLLKSNGPNRFTLDEQNGIILGMAFFKDRLISVFEVQGSWLHVAYIRTKKGIRFELSSSKFMDKTGGEGPENKELPIVQSYLPLAFQIAELKKI